MLAKSGETRYCLVMPRLSKKSVLNVTGFIPMRSEAEALADFMRVADAFDKKHRGKAAALKQLQKEGILTKSGKLTKNYGG